MTKTRSEASAVAETSDPLSGGAPIGVATQNVLGTVKPPPTLPLPVGAFMTDDHRYYFNGEGPLPSVTTLLGLMDKPAIVQWKARETAKAVISNWVTVCKLMAEQGQDAAVNWAVRESDKARDTAAKLGSGVHILADMVARPPQGDEKATEAFGVSKEAQPYMDAFKRFLGRYSASNIISSEKAVWSLNGYAGTYDMLMRIDGDLWLIDVKTSKGYYPEYGLQLAGYRWADYIIIPGDPKPYPMPKIDRTGVLHLRPDAYADTGWRLIEYPTDYQLDYLPFLGLVELWKWKQGGRFSKKNLKG